MHSVRSSFLAALLGTPLVLLSLNFAAAQVMQSSNYQIQSDSINIGGGLSSSTNYVQESTVGEIATGESSSATYQLKAGYQQMQEVFISISDAQNITMSPSIPGVSGGTSNGSTTVTVITDSPSGYALNIKASNAPALQFGANTIADYVPSGGDPDFVFDTGVNDSHFGYTPEGVDIVQRFNDLAGSCNSGSGDTTLACWDGLSTSDTLIASASAANHPNGATTSIRFRVGVGGSVVVVPGTYVATATLTALPL